MSQRRIVATPSQLRYIKSLLGASSRLGRALAELFGLLVKLCVGNRIRLRHPQNVTTNYISSASRDIARVLSYILVDGLSHNQLPPSPIPKLKQTFLICSIGFTSPMLFDEKRYAYHLMLHKFCEEGGLQAFFEMFGFALSLDSEVNSKNVSNQFSATIELGETNILSNIIKTQLPSDKKSKAIEIDDNKNVAESANQASNTSVPNFTADTLVIPKEFTTNNEEHGEFPIGSGEFLDAWLMLLEKMVNPKAILESPDVTTSKSIRNKPEFDTVTYLINVHILAFQTVTKIWSFKPIRTYGARMTESMLTIMKHIYQGEPILREKYNKKLTEQTSTTNEKSTFKFGSVFSRSTNPTESEQPTNRLNSNATRSTPMGNSNVSTNANANVNANANTRINTSTNTNVNTNTNTNPSTNANSNSNTNANANANANSNTNAINEEHWNQLIAMGFLDSMGEEHCREALYHTGSVEQALEYLCSHAAGTSNIGSALNENQSNAAIDSDDDENIDAEMMVLMGQKLSTENISINDKKAEASGR